MGEGGSWMSTCLSLEMALTREEFLRLLPGTLGVAALPGDQVFVGGEGPRSWSLTLVPLPEWRVGALRLPRLRVDFRFEGHSSTEVEAFMARFHRAFLRGGG